MWEAAQLAAHDKVDNLVAIVDVNGLGQSGPTMLDHDMRAYQRRFAAFGWRTTGHRRPRHGADRRPRSAAPRAERGAPSVIVARTVKGKGLPGVEGLPGWHGKPLPPDVAERVIAELEQHRHHLPPPPVRKPRRRAVCQSQRPNRWAAAAPTGNVATREAYGDALVRLGEADPRVLALDGDVKNSTFAERFMERFPERFVECFIAEQNMVERGGGAGRAGVHSRLRRRSPCFLERAADQIRMAGISRSNVKLCGSHAGVSIGEDGPSPDGARGSRALPRHAGSRRLLSGDGVATDAAVQLAANRKGLVYIRTTRAKTPGLYPEDAAFTVGGLKILRRSEHDRCRIVAAGITLHEALAAHDELATAGDRRARHRSVLREAARRGGAARGRPRVFTGIADGGGSLRRGRDRRRCARSRRGDGREGPSARRARDSAQRSAEEAPRALRHRPRGHRHEGPRAGARPRDAVAAA